MYEPLPLPWFSSIHSATRTFSVPWSPLTRLGVPWTLMASKKSLSTVSARLLSWALRPTTSRVFPSINPCITTFHRIKPAELDQQHYIYMYEGRNEYRVGHRDARAN